MHIKAIKARCHRVGLTVFTITAGIVLASYVCEWLYFEYNSNAILIVFRGSKKNFICSNVAGDCVASLIPVQLDLPQAKALDPLIAKEYKKSQSMVEWTHTHMLHRAREVAMLSEPWYHKWIPLHGVSVGNITGLVVSQTPIRIAGIASALLLVCAAIRIVYRIFNIDINVCSVCGYDVTRCTNNRCSECGTIVT